MVATPLTWDATRTSTIITEVTGTAGQWIASRIIADANPGACLTTQWTMDNAFVPRGARMK